MANTAITGLPVSISLDGSEYVPIQRVGQTAQRVTAALIGQLGIASVLPGSIEFLIDGAGSTISARTWGYLTVPFDATLTSATMLGDQSGSIIINVWKCTYSQFDAGATHPVSGDSITGSTPPTITSATKSTDTTLTGWTTSIGEGDILAFNVPTVATSITRVTLSLNLTRVVS